MFKLTFLGREVKGGGEQKYFFKLPFLFFRFFKNFKSIYFILFLSFLSVSYLSLDIVFKKLSSKDPYI